MCEGCPLLAGVREEVRRVIAETQRSGAQANGPLLVSVAQAGELLSLGQTEVYRLIQQGEIASCKIGRARRVVAASLGEYVRRLREAEGDRE